MNNINEDNFEIIKLLSELKSKLANTDYQAIKFAEGELTAEEYEPMKEQRKQWRKEINDLESQIETGGKES